MQVHVVVRPGATHGERHVERRRHARDLEALREPAADRDVRLQVVDRLVISRSRKRNSRPSFCPQASGIRRAAQLGHQGRVDLRQRLLEECEAVRLDHLGQMRRVIGSRLQLASMNSSMSGPTASRTARTRSASSRSRPQRPARRAGARLVADRHLQPGEALRDPELRGGRELLAVEEAEAEGGVHRHARARAAEQPPDRLAPAPCP